MNEAKAEAKTGYLVILDQCPRCGGLWCDRWELYPVTAAAAERIDAVDQVALHHTTAAAGEPLECPRCRAHMFPFRDPSLPEDARIERCPNCDGMWLNRGELRRFKARVQASASVTGAAAAHVRPGGRRLQDPELDRLTGRALDLKSWPTVSRLGDAFEGSVQTAGEAELRDQLKADALWLVARTVLRLLLHV